MSLSEFFIKNLNNKIEHSLPLAKLCSKIELSDDFELFEILYNQFPNYSMELTISPKSSPILQQSECATCSRTSLREIHEQNDIMDKLLEELVDKFKINLLGVTEYYKDKKHIHTHNITSPIPERIRPKIKTYIKDYYELNNNIIVNLKPINSKIQYMQYMMKENDFSFHYHNTNKLYSLDKIEEEYREKPKPKPLDEFQEHSITCCRTNCQICNWISCRNDK